MRLSVLMSCFVVWISCTAHIWASTLKPINSTESQSKTTIDVINKLTSRHYRDQLFDDDLSKRFLDKYLNSLDPARMYFYSSDIESFKNYSTSFDDLFKRGDLQAGFHIFHVFRQRIVSRTESLLEQLEDDNYQFDFSKKDRFLIDRKNTNWPASQSEADELWHKRLKLNTLNLKLAGKTVSEAKDILYKRYKTQLNRIKQQDSADAYETLINALTLLYDPHTNYWSPRTFENFNINMSLSLEGIGAVLQIEDEFTKVVRLVAGGPAARQGQLKSSDRIVGVAQGDNGELVDVVGWRLDEVVQLIRGPKNTVVKLEVIASDSASPDERKIIRINRGTVKLEDQAAKKRMMELSDGDILYKIGVIDIPAFYTDHDAYRKRDPNYRSTTRDVERLVHELERENVDGIIIDVRNNGGGSLREATQLTDLFINPGPVVQIRQSDNRISRHNRSRSSARYRGPLIVLTNRLSASASEIFAGAIQDYRRGLIVGSQTFGKGTVQSVTPLTEGTLKLTESKFYRVSGESTQHRGVIPDINLPVLIDHQDVGESTYENALEWDKIHAVPHSEYFNFLSYVPLLTELHEQRIAKDPDFRYLLDQLDMVRVANEKTHVSLNEKERREEKIRLETEAMNIDNKRRKAKGLALYKDLAAYRKTQDDEPVEESQNNTPTDQDSIVDIDKDPLLAEAGYILTDFVRLLNRPEQKQAANFQ